MKFRVSVVAALALINTLVCVNIFDESRQFGPEYAPHTVAQNEAANENVKRSVAIALGLLILDAAGLGLLAIEGSSRENRRA